MLRAIVKYSFLFGSILFAMLLALSRLIPTINPYEQSAIGILGLAIPALALINILFLIFWIATRKYFYVLIPVASILFSWKVFSVLMAGHFFCKQDFSKEKKFDVLSYNVRLLDLYNWSGKKETRENLIQYLVKKNADILCLQEFYTGNDSIGIDNVKTIQERCGYEFVAECILNENKRGKWGSVIFSHHRILSAMNHDVDVQGSNMLQQADIELLGDTISIYNIHLKSNRFSKIESDFVNKSEISKVDSSTFGKTKSIIQKLEQSSINRGLEASLVSKEISRNKHKVIVCGDLNDIPSSYVYFTIRGKLRDAFLEKGRGLGATYIQRIPVLRIDYIFCSSQIKTEAFEIPKEENSDHFPLHANFSLPSK